MTSLLRRKRPTTASNTAEAKGASALVAIALLALTAAPSMADGVLKIRSSSSNQTKPVAQRAPRQEPAPAERHGTLKQLAYAPELHPTPVADEAMLAEAMFDEPMFEEDVEQVAYEDYELISQGQSERPGVPPLNAVTAPKRKDCTIKNLRSINELTDNTQATAGAFPPECPTPNSGPFRPRDWDETTFMWKASALCHKPLYFEDVQLERYGHSWGPVLQPVVSGGMFFATVPVLPYKMGVEAPWECIYPLGYYRPGNCAPYMVPPIPVSVRGAATQAAAVTGGILLIP